MTRRALLARQPERPWVVWDPDRWILPVPWEGVALFIGLGMLVPGLLDLLLSGRRRSGFVVVAAGFLCAVVSALLTFWSRRWLRRRGARRARGTDWLCAACLHAEAS